ncbi:hypothetical protein DL98DRAFT_589741 [Cadophora sp. DSE1049]|nr:hypothetical protein DL98DRAFT_589741 [Cadophora sp. DSE1049]
MNTRLLKDDCNVLEDTLSAQEFKLQKLEERFYDRQLHDFPLDADETPRQASISSAYIGNVEILKERLEFHEDERFNLLKVKDTKRIAELVLASNDQEFLNAFDATKCELLDQLVREQAEVEALKCRCLAERLIEQDGTPKDFHIREQETFDNESALKAGSGPEHEPIGDTLNGVFLGEMGEEMESAGFGDDDVVFVGCRPSPLATFDTHSRSKNQFIGDTLNLNIT